MAHPKSLVPPRASTKSRTKSTQPSRSRHRARTQSSRPWSACASWCSRPPLAPRNSPLQPSRCPKCRGICWIPWTALHWSKWSGSLVASTKNSWQRPLRPAMPRLAHRAKRNIHRMNRELHIVGFQVGRETYGVPITSLHEIVRVPEITAVPDAPDYVEGVINLRGKIISIVDLRKRFGETKIQASPKNRILVAEIEKRLVGLIVDAASEVIRLPHSEIDAPPEVFEES